MRKLILSKLVVSVAMFAALALGAANANATTVFVTGVDTGAHSTATVVCEFNAATNTFTFTITNTSAVSVITGIGFDIGPGNINGFSGMQAPSLSSDFTFSDGDLGTVPHGFSGVVLDFGFITGSSFAGGNPQLGLDPGQSASFTVSGAAFAGLTEEEICNAIFVRFQGVPFGEGSDVGVPGDGIIPEPTSMLLLGSGLAGLGAAARRRRKSKKS